MSVPRLRMFAGPNGSGKSTIKSVLPPELLGVHLNPDEIEEDIRKRGFLNVRTFGVEALPEGILPFFANSTLLCKAEITEGTDLEMKCDPILAWFQRAVWHKIQSPGH